MKIKYIIAGLILGAGLFSCEVTDLVPEDAITDLNYWTKVEDLELFANNFYTTLSEPDPLNDEVSDNLVKNTPNDRLFNNMTIPGTEGGWADSDWENIRNCNYFLSRYQTVEGDEDEIEHYAGEIRFFRAHEYFNKVKTFGDVPWIDKDLTTEDEDYLMKARDSRNFVIDKIIEDLEFATDHLKLPGEVENGRVHRFAALQLLARVALYEGTWMKYRNVSGWESYLEKAAQTSQTIMDEGDYDIEKGMAPYTFEDSPLYYRQQFIQEDLTGNKECVLPRIYIEDILMHGLSRSVHEAGVGISKDFIESFLCIDGNPIAISPLYLGDDSLEVEMRNRDPRLRNMVDNPKLPYFLDGSTPISHPVTPIEVSTCPTGYLTSKFRSPEPAQNEARHSSYDWYVFRYAEVLLINAEAKAELGSITQTDLDNTINLLRSRLDEPGNFEMGRLTLNPSEDPLSKVNGEPRYGYEVSPLIYEIRRERRIELAFEGFRWDDIVRWKAGALIENPKTMLGMTVNDKVEERYQRYYNGTNPFTDRDLYEFTDWDGTQKKLLKVYSTTSRTWDDKLYLDPLPKDQIELNPNLQQNPGWN
jgi:hypothetical protein